MAGHAVTLIDGATAATLAQVLPLLLLTLAVEARRNGLHRELSRLSLATFFAGFGLIETVLVLSIDGQIYPFQWFDAVSALTIFVLLALVFRLSFTEMPES